MRDQKQQPAGPGRVGRLSRQTILTAAQGVLREEGAGNLSMRRLAKELSSTPMALYHHVRDKEELLLLLLDAHAEAFPRPELPEEPRERLLASAQVLHDILADCPWIVEVLASDGFVSVSAMWLVESMIDAAVGCGLTHEDAVYAYRVIWYYTIGELTVRFNRERARGEGGGPPQRERTMRVLTAEEYPQLARLGGRWTELATADNHRRGLEAVVDGLLRAAR
ncbi:TetR/AcrR family transcriptional regulator [Streptomyces halstedii]|uniref:TetR/AcrR family transcriptional regulator n=1 Tax=Streptomyces halstedii TaxID=1944 RepID=A0ABS6TTJ9_STRHA|nr:TetR/AcrR family transcriptional regulator [Streptomyces halstedii]MBV7671600.1 TetR/AcrR family transcriptional regulator [Streptomyces halstedii]